MPLLFGLGALALIVFFAAKESPVSSVRRAKPDTSTLVPLTAREVTPELEAFAVKLLRRGDRVGTLYTFTCGGYPLVAAVEIHTNVPGTSDPHGVPHPGITLYRKA